MPGGVRTALTKHVPAQMLEALRKDERHMLLFKSAAQGAATPVWAATSAVWEGRGGRYLEDCREAEASKGQPGVHQEGYAAWAYDQDKAARLWAESLAMVGLEAEAEQ